jgi:anaerobic selenocysteine-containing dehydrogenase
MRVKSACPLDCWDTCSFYVDVEDGRVVHVQGDADHPITQGFLCARGRRLVERRDSPYRLLHPLRRTGHGEWERVSWDEALDDIARRIRDTLRTYGHHSILHVYDWGSGTLLKSLNQRFFYLLGGCTETVGSLCWDAGLEAQRFDFGLAASHDPSDLVHARYIVVWGRNLANTNIHMTPFLKRALASGAQLVVVNPLATDLDHRAHLRIAPRPGTDGALALAALRICRDEGWIDDVFIRDLSVGWDELSAELDRLDLEWAARETCVPEDEIRHLAKVYGQGGPVATLLGLGMQRYAGGGQTVRAIDALAAATGNVGVPGGGVQYAQRGMMRFFDEDALTLRSRADVREWPRGMQADCILKSDPPIQVMFVTRTNPLTQVPDSERLRQAYATVPFKVVIDLFMTPTAEIADYVLPCTHVLEEQDLVFSTMWHPYVTWIEPALPPRGEVKPEWQIFAELAERLGFGHQMRGTPTEWLALALRPWQDAGLSLEELRRKGTVRLPLPEIPWSDGRFATPSGRFEFASGLAEAAGAPRVARYTPPRRVPAAAGADGPSGARRYALLTVHPRVSENSQHKDFPHLPPYPVAEVSRQLAEQEGLQDGALCELSNEQGRLMVRVRVVDAPAYPWVVKVEQGWWGQGRTVNTLTFADSADLGIQTAQYDCWCTIRTLRFADEASVAKEEG